MDLLATVAIVVCWSVVLVVWIGGAVYNASRGSRESIRGQNDVHTAIGAIGAIALVAVVVIVGSRWADQLQVTITWVRALGLVILVAATIFAVWARLAIGTSWSVNPRVGGDRRLRTAGPYAVTRHPIYTGLLGMLFGSALLGALGEWLVVIVAAVIVIEMKIRMEERLLLAVFPDEYSRYRARVPQLIPGLRVARRQG
jgi:protein-S-isoprenylcysteine O-methyltransferase Ste14